MISTMVGSLRCRVHKRPSQARGFTHFVPRSFSHTQVLHYPVITRNIMKRKEMGRNWKVSQSVSPSRPKAAIYHSASA
ncbi:hypothetical protein I7I50_12424 [Histoplasma capsulatum G186AR]|uniref:Uncharacterized protein n=1 Tax=Ajellomyces capsulatus TaxID=5037 RepID=A0A8H7YAM0_AJECA|nr:hypothetical protein I7I52_11269 [Histoplasma capsulatum]QSS70701.1 hypothetical protein I7I50_12424 [Histoplasma capsulatum G186AR]